MSGKIAKVSHQVYFWLKNSDSSEDLAALLAGLNSLTAIEVVRGAHIGVPAATAPREVLDQSYSASLLLFFDAAEDEKIYDEHPLHQKFINDHKHLWHKVQVYDAINNKTETDFGM
jgi:hypothetical protein